MRFGKDIIGKPVISINEGRHIGEVKDLYLNKELSQVMGLHLGREGLLKRKDLIIPLPNVKVMGIDAILVNRSDVVTDSNEYSDAESWIKVGDLKGRQVDTPGGTRVALVGDVLVGDSAEVEGFAFSRVYVEGPIAEKRLIMRSAVLDTGNEDGAMTIDISKAEQGPVM
ncbi:MAG: PRC-barrel domain-containing protein [Chloroflexi bacterium]|nr:PRC-barrel domain-containing protein [Chloroflexota bacterium]MBP8056169.1 PRC-barrel domain-containing protein [Chloroflexota bacterium]